MFTHTALGRITALALLLGLAALLYVAAIAPIHARYVEAGERIDAQRMLLASLAGEVARHEAARPEASAGSRSRMRTAYLEGESDAVKSARLQALVKDVAQAEGLRLNSVRALPVRDEEGLRLIGMEARFEASMASLQRMLLALETQRPLLLTHGLQLTPAAVRFASGEPDAGDMLNVGIEIYGAAPVPAARPAPPSTPPGSIDVQEPANDAR